MLRGVSKLPVSIKLDDALKIYKKLARVNKKMGKLDILIKKTIINQSLITLLSYNESVQSTRIEGTQVTFHEVLENKEKESLTWQQKEVLNYHKAIQYGFKEIDNGGVISTKLLKQLHNILMEGAKGTTSSGGEFRRVQNFIGPDSDIKNASYIPIGANEIDEYMTNLEYFINGQSHSTLDYEDDEEKEILSYDADSLLRIAISHAQFESIHPFLDGNGRLGRILIVLMAVKEEVLSAPIFFVSEELERERMRYYNSLNATRGEEPNWQIWLEFFLNASERMADSLIGKLTRAEDIAMRGLNKCKTENQKRTWLATFEEPVVTAAKMAQYLEVHSSTARNALDFLVSQGLLEKDLSAKRNIKYYNYDLIREIQK
ncbi:Fic family protein [Dolosicoccus paucivorans]|uniref:Fic family protein n=2 Tax=Dolosicoccus paucivorans TaxID=84521 RepID=A0A1G8KM64_9LACT|nr:Fic family protein [Dolosicoccus paucivorans]PMC58169.1 Fic family protein [Dolosicoccus paucivorans]SDI44488.1 Fic family protein [Dolosicoccus paucivorans]